MNFTRNSTNRVSKRVALFFALAILFASAGVGYTQISFTSSDLQGALPSNPTSLQFGPDGRLYVSQQNGAIYAYTIVMSGSNDYQVTATETINLVQNIPNHDDDGSPSTTSGRQVTGILVTGTASNPVLHVGSSDPRIGAGGSGSDTNLDTNSGIISRLTWNGSSWEKVDLIRGLPRSEENHSINGLQLDEQNNILYVAQGGNTNAGAPSNNFAFLGEFALSAAILKVDLDAVDAMPTLVDAETGSQYKYDLPTLDDPTRPNNLDGTDIGDPFGGNDGLNQAKLVPGGPVQIYSPGYRNAYDFVITKTPGKEGRMYVVDNGANGGWGGYPFQEGPIGNCTNQYDPQEPGVVNNLDSLHLVTSEGYYGGHPNPIRSNPDGAGWYWYDNTTGSANYDLNPTIDWPPVQTGVNPVECDFLQPGIDNGALITYTASTNGLAEYTATFFQGEMQGNLLAATWDGNIYRIVLNEAGDTVLNGVESFASGFGSLPLDVIAQGDTDIFPGTVWIALYGSNKITVLEPSGGACSGAYDLSLDEDGDGYSNADEIDNGTNPCSAASKPPDNDGDLISDLNDPDDDNDGIDDWNDLFAIDPDNGTTTTPPLFYGLFNNDPGTGFFGVGFTGLMANGQNYQDLYNDDNIVAGGASGLFTIVNVMDGDAIGTLNTQKDAFQFGINVNESTGPFTVRSRLSSPFFNGQTPQNSQSQGMYIGTGDQDNYLKIVLNANSGNGGIQVLLEDAGSVLEAIQFTPSGILGATYIDLYLSIDPDAGIVQPKYSVDGGAVISLGSPIALSGDLLAAVQGSPAMAVGLIATSNGAAPFTATWDFIAVVLDPADSKAQIKITPSGGINASTYTNGSFQIANISVSGQNITSVTIDLSTALLPDMVYDPDGTAGDIVAKDFTVNSDPGVGLLGHTLSGFHNGVDADDGYDVLEITFSDFNPGEVFTFSIDVDPTSIKGTSAPGPGESGSVSGLELTGATVDIQFNDGFTHSGETYRTSGSLSGSENIIRRAGPVKPGIQALNVATNPATVSKADQTIRVTGPVGVQVSLLIVEGAMFIGSNGGYDIDPYEANSVIAVNEVISSIGSGGVADIPVTLTKSDPSGGLNYIVAVLKDSQDGASGPTSNTIILEYDPSITTSENNINAGGPQVTTSGVTWSADQYFSGTSGAYQNAVPIAGTNDDVLYQSERYGTNFTYNIPVDSGTYTVNLHFAEIFFSSSGSRVFNVDIENSQGVLTNYDIVADVGPATAAVKAFQEISVNDGLLTITFSASVDNAKISAIEVLSSTGGGTAVLSASPDPLNFPQVVVGSSSTQALSLTNTGDSSLEVTAVDITGPNAAEFSHNFTGSLVVNPGAQVSLNVTFSPVSLGTKSATLSLTHTGDNSPVSVGLAGEGIDGGGGNVLFRVNCGGTELAAADGSSPAWSTDTSGSPSLYVNVSAAGNNIYSTSSTITLDASVAPVAPAALFQTERWDFLGSTAEMQWNFPVADGTYEIRLYFAEIYSGITAAGQRVFDVVIEDTTELLSYDIFAVAGGLNVGVMETFITDVFDGNLTIEFLHVVENPKISAIEIID